LVGGGKVVLSALLHGPSPPWGEGRKGLALRVTNILVRGSWCGPRVLPSQVGRTCWPIMWAVYVGLICGAHTLA